MLEGEIYLFWVLYTGKNFAPLFALYVNKCQTNIKFLQFSLQML